MIQVFHGFHTPDTDIGDFFARNKNGVALSNHAASLLHLYYVLIKLQLHISQCIINR